MNEKKYKKLRALYDEAEKHSDLAWSGTKRKENFKKTIELFTIVIEEDQDFLLAQDQRARCYHQLKEYENAINDFKQYCSRNPSAITYIALAELYMELKDFKNALISVEKAIENELAADHWFDLKAKINRKLGNINEAKADQKVYDNYMKRENAKWDDPDHYYHYK